MRAVAVFLSGLYYLHFIPRDSQGVVEISLLSRSGDAGSPQRWHHTLGLMIDCA
jgi:hypothetical protein